MGFGSEFQLKTGLLFWLLWVGGLGKAARRGGFSGGVLGGLGGRGMEGGGCLGDHFFLERIGGESVCLVVDVAFLIITMCPPETLRNKRTKNRKESHCGRHFRLADVHHFEEHQSKNRGMVRRPPSFVIQRSGRAHRN